MSDNIPNTLSAVQADIVGLTEGAFLDKTVAVARP